MDLVKVYPGAQKPAAQISMEVEDGSLVTLLGPSGCGKSTTLRMVAGFAEPTRGRILVDGRDITHLRPEHRPTAMVFQNYALWPHMDVWHNLTFGLEVRRKNPKAIRSAVEAMLAMVGLTGLEHRYPAQLSGGEQQRVALARALLLEPEVLLLDEPLSNLDAHMRVRVRDEVRSIQQRLKITTLFVTHDQEEATAIADKVAVMNQGGLIQFGTPFDIYWNPRHLFVADFVGRMNLLPGAMTAQGVVLGGVTLPPGGVVERPVEGIVGFRPEEVELCPDGAPGTQARVTQLSMRGGVSELTLEGEFGRLRAAVPSNRVPLAGTAARFVLRRVRLYDAATHELRVDRALQGEAGADPSRAGGPPPRPGERSVGA